MEVAAQLPQGPSSEAYANAQMALYEWIAGRPYSTVNEESIFDPKAAVVRPFPYIASCQVAGAHWDAMAFLSRSMPLRPGTRVRDVEAHTSTDLPWINVRDAKVGELEERQLSRPDPPLPSPVRRGEPST